MPNDDLLKYIRSFAPSSTATKKGQRPVDRTIGPATHGNIRLPEGEAKGAPKPVLARGLDHVAKGAEAVARFANPLPVLQQTFEQGAAAHRALKGGDTKGALAETGKAALTAAMFSPAGNKLVGKAGSALKSSVSKAIQAVSDQALEAGALPKRYAIITGGNPGGSAISKEANDANNAAMKTFFEDNGFKVTQRNMLGRYKDGTSGQVLTENPMLVHDVPERVAKLAAKKFGQNGVITQRGYHDLTSGHLFPSSGNVLTKDLPFTQLPNGQRFAANIDWDNPIKSGVDALPIPRGHNAEVSRITQGMVAKAGGVNLPRVAGVDKAAAKNFANVYEGLPKFDPAAKGGYDEMNNEVHSQYQKLKDQGFKFEYVNENPYKNSQEMAEDVAKNRRLKVFATPLDSFHPYMTADQNNELRAVHDLLAHAGEGNQFGPRGEENAYRVHMSTMSPAAQRALATETRGQNSWVNFGPNAHLPATERPFAEQKAALWPEHLLGDYPSMQPKPAAPLPETKLDFGKMAENMISGQRKLEAANPTAPPQPKGNGLLPAVADSAAGRGLSREKLESIANGLNVSRPIREMAKEQLEKMNNPAVLGDSAVVRAMKKGAPSINTKFSKSNDMSWLKSHGVFDRTVGDNQGTVASDPRLVLPAMGRSKPNEFVQMVADSKKVRQGMRGDIEKGIPMGGFNWYNTAPVDHFLNNVPGVPTTPFQWHNIGAGASASNSVPNEFSSATIANAMRVTGKSKEEVLADFAKLTGWHQEPPLMQMHLDGGNQALRDGALLPTKPMSKAWKIPSYADKRLGGGGVLDVNAPGGMPALDTKERMRMMQFAMTDPSLRKYATDKGIVERAAKQKGVLPFSNALDYRNASQPYVDLAREYGAPTTGAVQAPRWQGGWKETNLATNPVGDYTQLLENALHYTAHQRGMDTSPQGLRSLMTRVAQGTDYILPHYFDGPYPTELVKR